MSGILDRARPAIVALKAYSHAAWEPQLVRMQVRAIVGRILVGLPNAPADHIPNLRKQLEAQAAEVDRLIAKLREGRKARRERRLARREGRLDRRAEEQNLFGEGI